MVIQQEQTRPLHD